MNDLSILIIVGLLGVGIGFALGSLLIGSRSEHAQAAKSNPAPGPNMNQVASLWSERGKKQIYLQMDGKLIHNSNELSDDQRVRLKPAVESLNAWFYQPGHSPVLPLASLPTQPAPEAPSAHVPAAADLNSKPDVARPSMNPVNVLARAIQSDVSAPDSQPKSIALQVDEILQEKLKGTPLEKRGIRLMELPNKGMVVMVGLDQYDSVDAVRDEEARRLIRSAVAEWEERVSNK